MVVFDRRDEPMQQHALLFGNPAAPLPIMVGVRCQWCCVPVRGIPTCLYRSAVEVYYRLTVSGSVYIDFVRTLGFAARADPAQNVMEFTFFRFIVNKGGFRTRHYGIGAVLLGWKMKQRA